MARQIIKGFLPAKNNSASKLIVVLHGFRGYFDSESSIVELIRQNHPDADVYCPVLSYRWAVSMIRLKDVAAKHLDIIDQLWSGKSGKSGSPYSEIIVVGHSTGAVLARKLVVCAYGEIESEQLDGSNAIRAPFEKGLKKQKREWATSITRLVLLASMTRGWSVDSVKSRIEAIKWNIGAFFGHALFGRPTIFDIRRGAPFLVQTRLQWLELMRAPSGHKPENLIVVQLLGTIDNIVSPDDNLDFSIDRGKQFHLIQVPRTSHSSIVEVANSSEPESVVSERRNRISDALTLDSEAMQKISEPIELMGDLLPLPPNESVENVVFVIHGIRDLGYWTQKIATKVKKTSNGKFKSLTPSYGFFAMLPFVWWWIRRRKVEWFMDHYVEARAAFPRAKIDFVGHSNGSYLLAKAITDYPSCQVRNVVFAGSVVRSDYDWKHARDNNQVVKVLNYVATRDWVVASFPSAVRWISKFDLGGAGINGFDQQLETVANLNYVKGGHSAALVESQWDEIANFIVNGDVPVVPETGSTTTLTEESDFGEERVPWVKRLHEYSPFILILVLLFFCLGLWFFVLPLISAVMETLAMHYGKTLVTLIFLAIYIVVSRL